MREIEDKSAQNVWGIMGRRDFLKISALAAAGLALRPNEKLFGLDNGKDSNHETLSSSEKQGVLNTYYTPVTVIPLTDSFLMDVKLPVSMLTISETPLSFKNIITVTNTSDNTYEKYTLLPYFTGKRAIGIAQIEKGSTDSPAGAVKFYKSLENHKPAHPYGTEYSAFTSYYHNKIYNDLVALYNIALYQESVGVLSAGQEYSTLAMFNLKSSPLYLPGLNSEMSVVKGGGVCLIATTLSKALALGGAAYTERWEHPANHRYPANPEAPAMLLPNKTDATVDQDHDFKWKLPQNSWLSIDTQIMPMGVTVKNPLVDVDAWCLFSIQVTDMYPGVQSNKILDLLNAYKENAGNIKNPSTFNSAVNITRGDETYTKLNAVWPEENRSNFEQELQSDRFLNGLPALQNLINSYVYIKGGEGVGTYLTHTDWYQNQVLMCNGDADRKKLDAALRQMDYGTWLIKDQAVQCVGFAILLAGLPNNPGFRNVGGAVSSTGNPAVNVSELVPQNVKNGSLYSCTSNNGYYVTRVDTIEDVKTGDLPVRCYMEPGHIMGVVAKKTVNGEDWLLIADANAASDGKMRLRQISASTIDDVFGPYPFKKIVLR